MPSRTLTKLLNPRVWSSLESCWTVSLHTSSSLITFQAGGMYRRVAQNRHAMIGDLGMTVMNRRIFWKSKKKKVKATVFTCGPGFEHFGSFLKIPGNPDLRQESNQLKSIIVRNNSTSLHTANLLHYVCNYFGHCLSCLCVISNLHYLASTNL